MADDATSDRLLLFVTAMICVVWGGAMLTSFVNDRFSPPEGINVAFGAVTGYLFNRQLRKDS